jgi:hypothetical protein
MRTTGLILFSSQPPVLEVTPGEEFPPATERAVVAREEEDVPGATEKAAAWLRKAEAMERAANFIFCFQF